MRRYAVNIKDMNINIINSDVVIIGTGLAGLYTAYHIDNKLSCTILTKDSIETSSSSLAQGGIAAVTEKDDQFIFHFEDTVKAGCNICNEQAVKTIVQEGPNEIDNLIRLGTKFDVDDKGQLLTTMEGGHGRRRILHAGGDATGQEMVKALKIPVIKKENVTILENTFATDIVTKDNKVCGLVTCRNNKWVYYKTNYLVIASGGAGQVYRYTTNPLVSTGDGLAMALRAGAVLNNMEFVQFHPTGFYSPDNRNRQCFLISEAVRGEGGILLNDNNERFLVGRHQLMELAPRDIVAREIYREIQKQESPYVKLDITHKSEEYLKNRFPTIFYKCLENDLNISKEPIPVGPVQHYLMGGIQTDLMGRTSIDGLYACGESACTGVHGANRLASNSTMECLVFGRRCAQHINKTFIGNTDSAFIPETKAKKHIDLNIESEMINIKGVMVKYCGIIRNGKDILLGLNQVKELINKLDNMSLYNTRLLELYNMALTANKILKSALKRTKSIGAHHREDEGSSRI